MTPPPPRTGRPPVARAPMTARGWQALGAVAAVVAAVIFGAVYFSGSPTVLTSSLFAVTKVNPKAANSLPDLGGPHSALVPEVSLPVGARPYVGDQPTPPGFEFWEVPGSSHHDLVAQMRAELPTFASLNGMPWCGELSDVMTSWAWGTAAETVGVSLIDGGVMITRIPHPQGCRP